jgi:DNA-binding SARP family transcriptional activator
MSRRGGPRRSALESRTLRPTRVLRILLINGFDLRFGMRSFGLPLSVGRVVAFLALQRTALSRAFVAGTLWPDTSDGRASANLRSALWRLRQVSRPLVHATATRLQLSGSVEVDVFELEEVVRRIHDRRTHLTALDIQRLTSPAELLPGWYEDWVVFERERLRQLRLHSLDVLSERLVGGGKFAMAVEAALAAVREEPLRESSHRSLIRAHLAEGNVSEALREYRGYRQLLHDELGVTPSSEMEELLHPVKDLSKIAP